MRQKEYTMEKRTYKSPDYISKKDRKYKQIHPDAFRFHIFVRLKIINIKDDIFCICNNYEEKIELINMDSFFYFNEIRKERINKLLLIHN
jgi:hypothetical protein